MELMTVIAFGPSSIAQRGKKAGLVNGGGEALKERCGREQMV